MMFSYFIAGLISFGFVREVSSKSLAQHAAVFPISGFEETNYRKPKSPEAEVLNKVLSFIDNQEELLDVRIQEFNMNRINTVSREPPLNIKNEFERSYLLVKTQTTRRHRRKRYIQAHHTLCHFKICNMGRKRHTL